jgi:hypothetical protein
VQFPCSAKDLEASFTPIQQKSKVQPYKFLAGLINNHKKVLLLKHSSFKVNPKMML